MVIFLLHSFRQFVADINVRLEVIMANTSDYHPPTLTVDMVVFCVEDAQLKVLLINRTAPPFQGEWALPGGYNAAGETTTQAVERVMKTKVGMDIGQRLGFFEQLVTVDTVARDPRGHAVSVVYLGCGYNLSLSGGDCTHALWSVDSLPQVAFDHQEIIAYGRDRLIAKLSYSNAVSGLLGETFTLSQVQTAYEAVLGRFVDKRNFRKKFLRLGLVTETGDMWAEGAHRPAKLYRFNSSELKIFNFISL